MKVVTRAASCDTCRESDMPCMVYKTPHTDFTLQTDHSVRKEGGKRERDYMTIKLLFVQVEEITFQEQSTGQSSGQCGRSLEKSD